ncbi:MAG: enterotoxin, partial [Actinobacteria bacterium]|nr:enterotoxin [Actinomycetota bacterium]
MTTRREFLGDSAHLALGLGALQAGLGRFTFPSGPDFLDAGDELALPARAVLTPDDITLGNNAITAVWSIAGGAFRPVRLSDGLNRTELPIPASAFTLTLADKSTIAARDMRITAPPRTEALSANPRASRMAERIAGRSVTLTLQDASGRIEALWRGILRDGSHYIRQELTLRALGDAVLLREITLLDFNAPNAVVAGTVRGTPIVIGNAFFGFEHPLANNGVDGERVRCRMTRTLPLRPGTALTVSSVTGVAHAGQMRRDFLAYVERERAHPYRTFLHYNSWYDLGYF